jgi:thiamine-phosphate diphosphorylase
MAELRRPIICMVTDRRQLPDPSDRRLIRLVTSASRAGVTLVHLRERDLDDRRLLVLARDVVAAVSQSGTRVVVNDRLDVALASGAHGVHLREDSVSADRVRQMVPEGFLVGRSVHSAEQAARATGTGVDYIVMGTVYGTPSKPGGTRIAGLTGLAEACHAFSGPVLAIGGVTADNVGDIAATGAAGIAAIRLFAELLTDDCDIDPGMDQLVAGIRRAYGARSPTP